MTTNDNIRHKKLQCDINREASKLSALASGKMINMNILQVKKYYLLTKKRVIEHAKFAYCPLGKQQIKF